MRQVWCVWTEWGDYEQHTRDLRGAFATRELAEAHAANLTASKEYTTVDVVETEVLDALPHRVSHIEYSAHITPDGREDEGLGYARSAQFETWSNEIRPLNSSRVDKWGRPTEPDLFIEVTGSDRELVAAEYARLLTEARQSLAEGLK